MYYLLVFVLGKLILLTIVEIPEKNLFRRIYNLMIMLPFVSIDMFIVYPATKEGYTIEMYAPFLVSYLFLLILHRILNGLTDLRARHK